MTQIKVFKEEKTIEKKDIEQDILKNFNVYRYYIDMQNDIVEMIVNVKEFINEKEYTKDRKEFATNFSVKKEAKDYKNLVIRRFKEILTEKTRFFTKDSIKEVRLARVDEMSSCMIGENDIIKFDVWGVSRKLIVRAYIYAFLKIDYFADFKRCRVYGRKTGDFAGVCFDCWVRQKQHEDYLNEEVILRNQARHLSRF